MVFNMSGRNNSTMLKGRDYKINNKFIGCHCTNYNGSENNYFNIQKHGGIIKYKCNTKHNFKIKNNIFGGNYSARRRFHRKLAKCFISVRMNEGRNGVRDDDNVNVGVRVYLYKNPKYLYNIFDRNGGIKEKVLKFLEHQAQIIYTGIYNFMNVRLEPNIIPNRVECYLDDGSDVKYYSLLFLFKTKKKGLPIGDLRYYIPMHCGDCVVENPNQFPTMPFIILNAETYKGNNGWDLLHCEEVALHTWKAEVCKNIFKELIDLKDSNDKANEIKKANRRQALENINKEESDDEESSVPQTRKSSPSVPENKEDSTFASNSSASNTSASDPNDEGGT